MAKKKNKKDFTNGWNDAIRKLYQKPDELFINLKIKRITVLQTTGTDIIYIFPDLPSSFPEMEYPIRLQFEARKGYAVQYCKEIFGIEPEILKTQL